MNDELTVFRFLIPALALFGMGYALWLVNRASVDAIDFGGRIIPKRRFITLVLVWNAVAIPVLIWFLFAAWKP